jgi:hypothetical protein
MFEFFEAKHAALLSAIKTDKKFGKNLNKPDKISDTTRKVVDALTQFKGQFS